MNQPLVDAENALIRLLEETLYGLSMADILRELGENHGEAELRAAVWTLRADMVADFSSGLLRKCESSILAIGETEERGIMKKTWQQKVEEAALKWSHQHPRHEPSRERITWVHQRIAERQQDRYMEENFPKASGAY